MNLVRLEVTVPVFNEEAELAGSIERLRVFLAAQAGWGWRIVIAENGSTDRTWAVALELAARYEEVQAVHRDRAGRGGALKAAWLASDAEVLSYMDVDLSTELACFPPLIGAVAGGQADVAIGSRLLRASAVRRSWQREVLSRGYNQLARGWLGLGVRDTQCGFKALSRQAAQALLPHVEDNGWFFDTELLFRARAGGWRIAEVPVRWVEDGDSRVRLGPTIMGDLRGLWRLGRDRRAATRPPGAGGEP